jgi:nitroreductase
MDGSLSLPQVATLNSRTSPCSVVLDDMPLALDGLGSQVQDDVPSLAWELTSTLIASRQNISPKRLVAPGPSAQQLDALMRLAAAAPDHGLLTPWRFVLVPMDKRSLLAEAFALALVDRDPGATLEQLETAREKAYRSPLLMMAIGRLCEGTEAIPAVERLVSAGCAIQNLLLGAHALGFGVGLTSGQALQSPRVHTLFGLSEGEVPLCCVNIGTISKRKPSNRLRPQPQSILSSL